MVKGKGHRKYDFDFSDLKPGMKLLVKPLSWYKENVNELEGIVQMDGCYQFADWMSRYCGKRMTVEKLDCIDDPFWKCIRLVEADGNWSPPMFDCIILD